MINLLDKRKSYIEEYKHIEQYKRIYISRYKNKMKQQMLKIQKRKIRTMYNRPNKERGYWQ